MTASSNALSLQLLQARIRECRRCAHEGFHAQGPPVASSPPNCRVMLVGQAPALASTEAGRNFVGRAGRVLFSWFERIGLDERTARRAIYLSALTRCYPGRNPKGGDRKPSSRELALCRPFLEEELKILNPTAILPVGQMAIERFLGRGPLETWVGRSFQRDGRLYMPLPHPSGASRWLNVPENRERLSRALELIQDQVLPLLLPAPPAASSG